MKIKYYIFLFVLFPFTTSAYSLVTKTVDGHRVRIFHIGVGDIYKVTTVASNTGTTLKNLVDRVGGIAGINGAYFIPQDYT